MRLIYGLLDRSGKLARTTSRLVAVLCGFAGVLAVGVTHAGETEYDRSFFADIISSVDSGMLDAGADASRIELTLQGEQQVFKRESRERATDGRTAWSGRNGQGRHAASLYVARKGDDVSIKLVKGGVEYDITRDSRADYELRATDRNDTTAEQCLEYEDHATGSTVSPNRQDDTITTLGAATAALTSDAGALAAATTAAADVTAAVATTTVSSVASTTTYAPSPLEIIVNLAYTKAALAQYPSATALANAFVIGLTRVNDALRNSNLNARVKLGRVVLVDKYRENTTLKLVRQDVENGRVPGLPVPTGKNKTVLVVDVFGKWTGTAMLAGPYVVIKHHAISTMTLAHEMGHSFGGIHEKAYKFRNGHYTAMLQSGLREPIYSNPKVPWLGERAGTAKLSNSQRMCNEFFKLGRGCWIKPQ